MTVADMLNSYTTIRNKEELADTVSDLFADDVPAFALARKTRVAQPVVMWTDDNMHSSSKTGIVEGATVTYTGKSVRTLRTNYTQIRLRSWEVTHSQEAADPAGVKSEVGRQLMKAMKALLTDYSKIILATNAASAGTTAAGRVSAGIQNVATNNYAAGSGTGSTSYIKLSEKNVNSVLQQIWADGGNPTHIICGGYQKRVISQNFTAKTGFSFNIDAGARTAINNINKYEGSFGTVDVLASREAPGCRVAVISKDMWEIGIFRDIEQHKGAKTSSSWKGWVEAEMCLKYGNPLAHGQVRYCTTSFAL
jgi:hypothetical protein